MEVRGLELLLASLPTRARFLCYLPLAKLHVFFSSRCHGECWSRRSSIATAGIISTAIIVAVDMMNIAIAIDILGITVLALLTASPFTCLSTVLILLSVVVSTFRRTRSRCRHHKGRNNKRHASFLVVVVVAAAAGVVVVGAPGPTNHPSYIIFSHTSVLLGIYSTFVM